MNSVLTRKQVKTFGPKPISGWGNGALIKAKVRYDDECNNGHNTFAITGEIYIPRRRDIEAGGCLHEEIAKAFPELAPFIKWHLMSSDGPMHYLANTLYLAGNRDCFGRTAGEPSSFLRAVEFTGIPIKWRGHNVSDFLTWLESAEGSDFEVIRIDHEREPQTFGPKYTLGSAPDKWYQCPFDTEGEALEFLEAMKRGYKVVRIPTAYSEGKVRELDKARSAAIWPDATDEELMAPDLKAKLEARLPELIKQFKADVESLGFVF